MAAFRLPWVCVLLAASLLVPPGAAASASADDATDDSFDPTPFIVVGVILLFLSFVASKSIFIVHQAEGMVIERLGKFDRVLSSGINFAIPIIEAPRAFMWRRTYIDANGKISDESQNLVRIDLRENVFNFMRQEVYTKDTILLDVNSLMYYRISDIKKAIYEVDDLQSAIVNVAQTQLKEVFGSMTFTQAMESQEVINAHMMRAFGPRFSSWGIKVERMELLDMRPKQGVTYSAMKKQMVAERDRRAEFIIAEGEKAAMRLRSEGTKRVKLNLGLAEQEATRKKSEGQRDSTIELARAESKALETIGRVIAADNCRQSEYMIAQRYVDLFRDVMSRVDHKVLYFPYQAMGIAGLVDNLPSVYGMSAARKNPRDGQKGRKAAKVSGRAGGDFSDLN